MSPAIWIAVVLFSAMVVALWSFSTEHRRDELARDFAKQVFLVDGISEASAEDGRIRALHPYLARTGKGSVVVLAARAQDAAELVLAGQDGEVAISCLLGKHRVVSLGRGRWAVAALPGWLGMLGKVCEHGGAHA